MESGGYGEGRTGGPSPTLPRYRDGHATVRVRDARVPRPVEAAMRVKRIGLRGAQPRRRHMPRSAAKPKCDGSIGTQPAGSPFASTKRHCRMPAAYGGDGT